MVDPVVNKGKVTVSTGYNSTATSIVLATGQGAELPDPVVDGAYNLPWYDSTNYNDPADDPNYEIVRVTGPAGTGDTKTIVRAQEGTAATNKNNADATYKMHLGVTAKTIADVIAIENATGMEYQSFTNLITNADFGAWTAGDASAPDNWTVASATIAKESTIIKINTHSAKVIIAVPTTSGRLVQTLAANEYLHLKGNVVTIGVWVYSGAVGVSRILLNDGVSSFASVVNTVANAWEFIIVTGTVSASASAFTINLYPDFSNNTSHDAYFDGVILVEGSVCPAFSPLPISANDLTIHMQTPQTLTGADAVDIITDITHIVTTAADALTLIDGAEGQEKFIVMKTDGGDGTLTPSNLGNGTTITFDAVGDSAHLLFTNGAWHFIGGTATLA